MGNRTPALTVLAGFMNRYDICSTLQSATRYAAAFVQLTPCYYIHKTLKHVVSQLQIFYFPKYTPLHKMWFCSRSFISQSVFHSDGLNIYLSKKCDGHNWVRDMFLDKLPFHESRSFPWTNCPEGNFSFLLHLVSFDVTTFSDLSI